MMTAMLLAGTTSARADDLAQVLARARAAGLPTTPLANKVREGRAKRVPEARILMVIKQLSSHMLQARRWLTMPSKRQAKVPARLLAAVAEARLAGLSEQTLRRLVPPGSSRGLTRRVDALMDLHLRGYRADDAVDLVQRTPPSALSRIGQQADRLRKAGLSRAGALDALLNRATGKGARGALNRTQRNAIRSSHSKGAAYGKGRR